MCYLAYNALLVHDGIHHENYCYQSSCLGNFITAPRDGMVLLLSLREVSSQIKGNHTLPWI